MRWIQPLLLTLALVIGALAAPPSAAAQLQPSPELHQAYFAWDEGDYMAAARGYLEVLQGPNGQSFTQEVAGLTGERHPTREVDDDGQGLAISPDGRFIQWRRQVDDTWMTFVEPLEGGAQQAGGLQGGARHSFPTRIGALSGTGLFAWVDGEDRVEITGLGAREGDGSRVALEGIRPVGLAFSPDQDVLYLTGGQDGDRLRIFRLQAPEWRLELLDTGEGHAASPQPVPGGRHLVFHRPEASPLSPGEGEPDTRTPDPGPGLMNLETGEVAAFSGGASHLSAGGGAMAWLQPAEGGQTRVMALRLDAGDPLRADPLLLVESGDPLDNPAVSPDGSQVAYQGRPHLDWEIYRVAIQEGGSEPIRVTREIQHDLFPAWISDTRILAMKGEFRHRRSYLHDLETGESYRLFHNNTFRTIAPEYEWVVHPQGEGILLVAERDGDTIAPERAVFWVDLTRGVEHADLVSRLADALAHEEALMEAGTARFAPEMDEIRAATDAVSVGRIYHYAEILYSFGSKFATEPGNQEAIQWLAETLESWGYEAELQWFEATGRGQGARTANVVATLPGTENPEQVYLISSHFDSVLPSPGADDNSSGTTALLEAARVLADSPRKATIQFVFLTAEEAGLLGAREYVRVAQMEGAHIAGVLNNDMIGWTRSHRLDNTIRYSNDGIRDIQHAAAHLFSDLITYDARYYRGTDAAVFFDAYGDIVGGIGSYPVLHNPNYHQVTDELWTINQRLVAEVSRTTVATIMHLADGPSRVEGLHRVAGEGSTAAPVFAWDPAPEAMVTGYEVRVRRGDGDGEWEVVDQVTEPRVQLTEAHTRGVDEVGVRAVTADGRSSFDDRRLPRREW